MEFYWHRLRCSATGFPRPTIEWIRDDDKTIPNGAWNENSMIGETLNFTKVNREHMGLYICIADNGIPPSKNQTFQIDIHCKYVLTYL